MILTTRSPDDVYALVIDSSAKTQTLVFWCMVLVGVLCVLVALQIVAKIFIFRAAGGLMAKVVTLLEAVQAHGNFTDAARKDTQEAATAIRTVAAHELLKVDEVKKAVAVVDEKVTAVKDHIEGGSQVIPQPAYAGPQNRRAEDQK